MREGGRGEGPLLDWLLVKVLEVMGYDYDLF